MLKNNSNLYNSNDAKVQWKYDWSVEGDIPPRKARNTNYNQLILMKRLPVTLANSHQFILENSDQLTLANPNQLNLDQTRPSSLWTDQAKSS